MTSEDFEIELQSRTNTHYKGFIYPDESFAEEIEAKLGPYLMVKSRILWSKVFPQDRGTLVFEVTELPIELRDQLLEEYPPGKMGSDLKGYRP